MRTVTVERPSFPSVECNKILQAQLTKEWQVVCGDTEHYRCGIYSPAFSTALQIVELESHTCPEVFLLLSGRLTLLLNDNGKERELALELGKPVVIDTWHNGYCPDGPHTGSAFVVERDAFTTTYKPRDVLRKEHRALS